MSEQPTRPPSFDPSSDGYQQLVQTIANGDAWLFAGSGCSAGLRYPLWDRLIADLERMAEQKGPEHASTILGAKDSDPYVRAKVYKDILGERYYGKLAETFGPKAPGFLQLHELLASIPFRHVLTTNYDPALELAFAASDSTSPIVIRHHNEPEMELFSSECSDHYSLRRLVYLHGHYSDPRRIVLCEDSYKRAYANGLANIMRLFFGFPRLVFVGFGLCDPDVTHAFRDITRTMGPTPKHFVIADEANEGRAADYHAAFKSTPIFYNPIDASHSGLIDLLRALEKDVASIREAPSTSTSTTPPTVAVAKTFQPTVVERPDSSSGDSTKNQIDLAIDDVFAIVKDGRPADAIRAYRDIQSEHSSELSDKHRYRIEANIGNAYYAMADTKEAAASYLRAVRFYNESKEARALEILAYHLLDRRETAHRLAQSLASDEPGFARAHALLVRTIPDGTQFDAIEAQIPEVARSHGEVAFALSDHAELSGAMNSAEQHARAACRAEPDWTEATAQLARVLVRREQLTARVDAHGKVHCENIERVKEAIRLLDAAIPPLLQNDPAHRAPILLFQRAMANRLVGNNAATADDIRHAFTLNPGEPAILQAFALEATSPEDISEALRVINETEWQPEAMGSVSFAELTLLQQRGSIADKEAMYRKARQLCATLNRVEPEHLRISCAELSLSIARDATGSDGVQDFLAAIPPGSLRQHELAILQGYAALEMADNRGAAEFARKAAQDSDGADIFSKRAIAALAMQCELFEEAFQVWSSFADPKLGDIDGIRMLQCAFRTKNFKQVLAGCKAAREAGKTKRVHIELEVEVLVAMSSIQEAIGLLREWTASHPEDEMLRLSLDHLTVRHNYGTPNIDTLPSPDMLERVEHGMMLVELLSKLGHRHMAAQAAYQVWRRFPEEQLAHEMLLQYALLQPGSEPATPTPEQVGAGVAVEIQASDERPIWVYIEDGPNPSLTRGEYPPDHLLCKSMEGRTSGDTFRYGRKQYTILRLVPAAIWRAVEVRSQLNMYFPDSKLIVEYKLPSPPPGPPADLKEVLGDELTRVLEQRAEYGKLVEAHYSSGRIPLAMFAKELGRSSAEMIRDLAFDPSRRVLVDDGNDQRWIAAIESLEDTPPLVLDSSALGTITALDAVPLLKVLGTELFVPQAAVDELRNELLMLGRGQSTQGHIASIDGEIRVSETSAGYVAELARRIEAVLDFVQAECTVVGGLAALDLDGPWDDLDELEGTIGRPALHAFGIAKQHNALLWADDFPLQRLAASPDFSLRAVSTPAVVYSAAVQRRILADQYYSVLADLIKYQYHFVRMGPADVAMLCHKAGWNPQSPTVRALHRYFGDINLANVRGLAFTVVAISLIWISCPSRENARDIVIGAIEHIEDPAGRMRLRRAICAVGDLPPQSHRSFQSLRNCLRRWWSRDGEFRPSLRCRAMEQ